MAHKQDCQPLNVKVNVSLATLFVLLGLLLQLDVLFFQSGPEVTMRGSLALTLTFLDWEPEEGWGTGGLGGCDAGGEDGDTEGEVGGGGGAEVGGGGGGGAEVGGGGGGGAEVDGGGGGGGGGFDVGGGGGGGGGGFVVDGGGGGGLVVDGGGGGCVVDVGGGGV